MSTYELLFLRAEDNSIERFEHYEATDAEQALDIALSSPGVQPREIWIKSRQIARVESSGLVTYPDKSRSKATAWFDRETAAQVASRNSSASTPEELAELLFREEEERQLAARSVNFEARNAHSKMAEAYRARIDGFALQSANSATDKTKTG